MRFNIVSLAVIIFGMIFLLIRTAELGWTPLRIAGIAIITPAFVLFVIARIQLGRAFSIQARAQTLVTTGIYKRIRNPIYVFSTIIFAGLILWSGAFWLFLILVPLIALQYRRSGREAQVLSEKFGDDYLEYRRKTWF